MVRDYKVPIVYAYTISGNSQQAIMSPTAMVTPPRVGEDIFADGGTYRVTHVLWNLFTDTPSVTLVVERLDL